MPKKKQNQKGATEAPRIPGRETERNPDAPDIPNPTVPNRAETEMKKSDTSRR